jgi:hypothetical protein
MKAEFAEDGNPLLGTEVKEKGGPGGRLSHDKLVVERYTAASVFAAGSAVETIWTGL